MIETLEGQVIHGNYKNLDSTLYLSFSRKSVV